MPTQTINCKHCGETFTRFQTGEAAYCSNKCARYGNAKKYTLNGESLPMREWAARKGADPKAIRLRLSNGMSFEDAINKPIRKFAGRSKKFSAFGECKTIKQWAEYAGLNYGTLNGRLRRGVPIEDALTAPLTDRPKRKPMPRPKPEIPKGCYWEGKYRVVCPDGKVFDHTKRNNQWYPKPTEYICVDCSVLGYWDRSLGVNTKPKRCRKCNAYHGSRKHVEAWADLREELGVTKWSSSLSSIKHRCLKHGCEYTDGIDAATVAERFDHECQECGIMLQPHKGGFHPEGWTVGHLMPLSNGGPHTWGNVQAECLACNMWKGNKRPYVDWDEVTNSVTM